MRPVKCLRCANGVKVGASARRRGRGFCGKSGPPVGAGKLKGKAQYTKSFFPLVPKRMACFDSHVVSGGRQRRHEAAFRIMHLGSGIIL